MNKDSFIFGFVIGIVLTFVVLGSVDKFTEWNNLKDRPKYESFSIRDADVMVSEFPKYTDINMFIKTDSRTEYYDIDELQAFENFLGGEKRLLHNRSDHKAYECDAHTFEKRFSNYSVLNKEINIILYEDSNCSSKYPINW